MHVQIILHPSEIQEIIKIVGLNTKLSNKNEWSRDTLVFVLLNSFKWPKESESKKLIIIHN